MRSPSWRKSRGLSRGSPDLRPIVVRIPTSVPLRNLLPILPLVFLKTNVCALDIHLMAVPTLAEFRPSICLAFRGRDGSGFGLLTGATLSLDEGPDVGPDVLNLAVGGEDEGLVDVGAHPSAGKRRFGDDVELRPERLADDGELRRGGLFDDPV